MSIRKLGPRAALLSLLVLLCAPIASADSITIANITSQYTLLGAGFRLTTSVTNTTATLGSPVATPLVIQPLSIDFFGDGSFTGGCGLGPQLGSGQTFGPCINTTSPGSISSAFVHVYGTLNQTTFAMTGGGSFAALTPQFSFFLNIPLNGSIVSAPLTIQGTATTVPEPGSFLLMSTALCGLWLRRRSHS